MMRWIVFGAASALMAAPASAPAGQSRDAAFARDFRRFLAEEMPRFGDLAGLSVAVAHARRPVFVAGLGLADRARRLAVTADTRFYIASSTKSFVALAMAVLAERGAIDLDWTLAELAPDVKFGPDVHPERITLRHLLSHSHGLRNDALQFRLAYSGDYDAETLWRLVARSEPNARAPLGSFAYSNLGYNLATMLIERKLGRPWQEILEREVLRPLGLSETAARGLGRSAPRALPYAGPELLYLRKTDRTMQSAGGMESSARDMARWLEANLAAEAGLPVAVPHDALLATHRPIVGTDAQFGPFVRSGYGLGWYSGPYRGATLYHAFGGFTGFRAHVSFVPSIDLGVAVNSNEDGGASRFVDIAAAYAYDWYLIGPARAKAEAEVRIEALQKDLGDERAKRAQAGPPEPGRPTYAGRFCNADWGTIQLSSARDGVLVRMGALHARAMVGGEAGMMRVELIPGQATKLRFDLRDGRLAQVQAFGADFVACS